MNFKTITLAFGLLAATYAGAANGDGYKMSVCSSDKSKLGVRAGGVSISKRHEHCLVEFRPGRG